MTDNSQVQVACRAVACTTFASARSTAPAAGRRQLIVNPPVSTTGPSAVPPAQVIALSAA
nr:hypothetical protein [Kribbella catacumbae]